MSHPRTPDVTNPWFKRVVRDVLATLGAANRAHAVHLGHLAGLLGR